MKRFVYDGSVTGHAVWRVGRAEFPQGIPVAVTETQACKLRCLPFFAEAPRDGDVPIVAVAAVVHEPSPEPVNTAPTAKRGRGRPPGSKNKPKVVTDGNENAG